jgi:isoquinoline 1-oxidoreductase beta subunit
VKAVVRVPVDRGGMGVAVIADGYWPAKQGRDALKLEWDTSGVEKADSTQLLASTSELAQYPGAAPSREHVRSWPGAAQDQRGIHLPLPGACADGAAELHRQPSTAARPNCGWARRCRAWTRRGRQDAGRRHPAVKVNTQMAGGGFGRRAMPTSDYVVEACNVAKAARAAGLNAPVRTLWSREDDIKGGYYRPMHVHRAEIGFDAQGNILAWDHVIVGQSILKGSPFEDFMVKDGIDSTMVEGMKEPYDVPMRLTVHHPQVNVPVLWWRSVGSTHTAYVMETLLDEVARATSQDPVACA